MPGLHRPQRNPMHVTNPRPHLHDHTCTHDILQKTCAANPAKDNKMCRQLHQHKNSLGNLHRMTQNIFGTKMLSGFSEGLRNLQYRLKKTRSLLDMKCVQYDTNFIEFAE